MTKQNFKTVSIQSSNVSITCTSHLTTSVWVHCQETLPQGPDAPPICVERGIVWKQSDHRRQLRNHQNSLLVVAPSKQSRWWKILVAGVTKLTEATESILLRFPEPYACPRYSSRSRSSALLLTYLLTY